MEPTDRPAEISIQLEEMVQNIKSMEPKLGKVRVKQFAMKTLQAQLKHRTISKAEYDELMSKLGYNENHKPPDAIH